MQSEYRIFYLAKLYYYYMADEQNHSALKIET